VSEAEQRGPLQDARRSQLLAVLARHGTARVSALTRELGVSAVTVRRDLVRLAEEGLVRRVHGGATLLEPAPSAPPSAHAGARRRPGRSIGMLVPALNYYWPDVVRGAERAARERHLRLRLRGSSYEAFDDRPQLERFLSLDATAGLLVALRPDSPTSAPTLEWLASTQVPVVLVERQAHVGPHHDPMESVMTDHALGAAMAVRHLVRLGHERVALLTNRFSPTSPHVRRGWFEATLETGSTAGRTIDVEVPDPGAEGWNELVESLLEQCRSTGTTAVLVHADAEAIALVQHCERLHISVPGDLSVVAYDDTVAGLYSPALTAVRPPRSAIGRAAVELLTARLADPGRPPHRVMISPALELRASSAPPRRPTHRGRRDTGGPALPMLGG